MLAPRIGLWSVVSCGGLLACGLLFASHHSAPSELLSRKVRVDGKRYRILTCAGVNETQVRCGLGEAEFRMDGALVCTKGRFTPVADPLPASLCNQLPKGCKPFQRQRHSDEPFNAYKAAFLAALQRESIHVEPNGATPWLSIMDAAGTTTEFGAAASEAFGRTLPKVHYYSYYTEKCDSGRCVFLSLWEMNRLATPADTLAKIVGKALRDSQAEASKSGTSVRVRLSMAHSHGPRCSPENPLCGPVPYTRGCLGETNYQANAKREVITDTPGLCENDGDCSIDSNCDVCESRFTVASSLACPNFIGPTWARTYCGCVNGRCSWFRQ